ASISDRVGLLPRSRTVTTLNCILRKDTVLNAALRRPLEASRSLVSTSTADSARDPGQADRVGKSVGLARLVLDRRGALEKRDARRPRAPARPRRQLLYGQGYGLAK